jgi:hypothetical protein
LNSIIISIVSHLQAEWVKGLLSDIQEHCQGSNLTVLLTLNKPEALPFTEKDYSFDFVIRLNARPRGFGANHNAAFHRAGGDFFCILNPDIRMAQNPFPVLLDRLKEDKSIGVISPLVRDRQNRICDNARHFPSPGRIMRRLLSFSEKNEYAPACQPLSVDWLAGIFLLFPSPLYRSLQGFDEKYFLYLEDADLCARIKLKGYRVLLDPEVCILHEARRSSHHRPLYLLRHLKSLGRFFLSPVYRRLQQEAFIV